jgi:hypothetical protein
MPEDRLHNYLLDCKPKRGKRSRGQPRKSLNDVYIIYWRCWEKTGSWWTQDWLYQKTSCRSKGMKKFNSRKLYDTTWWHSRRTRQTNPSGWRSGQVSNLSNVHTLCHERLHL